MALKFSEPLSGAQYPPQFSSYVPEFPPTFRSMYQDTVGPVVIPQGYTSSPSMVGGAAPPTPIMGAPMPYQGSYLPQSVPLSANFNSVQAYGYVNNGAPRDGVMPFINKQNAYVRQDGIPVGINTGGCKTQEGGSMASFHGLAPQMYTKPKPAGFSSAMKPILQKQYFSSGKTGKGQIYQNQPDVRINGSGASQISELDSILNEMN